MSPGLNFQYLSGRSSRSARRSRCSSLEMCSITLTTRGVLGRQVRLEVVDGAVAALDLLRRREPPDLVDQHVLVVRAVEDPDVCRPPGSCRAMRHRKSRFASAAVGALNAWWLTPCGSTAPMTWRMMPPLPEVSIPWRISRTFCRAPSREAAKSRSCSSPSAVPSTARSAAPDRLSPLYPGFAQGSTSARSKSADAAKSRCAGSVERGGSNRVFGLLAHVYRFRDRGRGLSAYDMCPAIPVNDLRRRLPAPIWTGGTNRRHQPAAPTGGSNRGPCRRRQRGVRTGGTDPGVRCGGGPATGGFPMAGRAGVAPGPRWRGALDRDLAFAQVLEELADAPDGVLEVAHRRAG